MAKPVIGRSLRLEATVLEKREGDYGEGIDVAKHTFHIPLPARSSDVAQTVVRALDFMALTMDQFRGAVPDVASTTVIEASDDAPPF